MPVTRQGDTMQEKEAQAWAEQEPQHAPLWQTMMDASAVGQNTVLFDAGCGCGGASGMAAARGARVTGLDLADERVQIARERVPEGEFHTGSLDGRLPFAEKSFDVSIASLVLMYVTDPIATLRELARVTSGPVAAGVWADPDLCQFADYFHTMEQMVPPPPGAKSPFSLSGKGVLTDLFAGAGYALQDQGEVDVVFEYANASAFWNGRRWGGSTQRAIEIHGEDHVKAELLRMAEKHQRSDGRIRFENRIYFAMGTPLPA